MSGEDAVARLAAIEASTDSSDSLSDMSGKVDTGNIQPLFVTTVHMISLFAHAFHSCLFFSFLTISDPCVLLAERNARLRFR